MSKLYNYYKHKVIKKLMLKFQYKSIMQVPCIKKITLNMGVGKVISDKKYLDNAINDLTIISGQKPLTTKSHKSIAAFKIRKGYPIGCKVTLRKKRMWNFFERLLWVVIPRMRDFRGLSKKSFDHNGNYSIGIKEQIIFPEINFDKIDHIRGLNITITTNNISIKESYSLFKEFKFPFRS
ncbi:50S ribosomal protein L5 [Enterobacteriaceae endosymbiont of Donacia marginata]|uniref:50S ribosomal protein L5 n=1 Tax=Enterobacteriaceae endosymbiont of Donacia marginata TaxID=2675779 RepID=UPI001448C1F7|nr:50S ribosomal protein L5 [Enterobacteriaceae endosymbiont of Donacia marginata]QJC38183.1 50S ribosomal protein L5 [Enterobacteriaceae endosymbiont of Donacia marginata]